MSDNLGEEPQLPWINLTYFIWLPAGKDEFGFHRQAEAPMFATAYYRTLARLERTIASHFEDKVLDLTDRNKLAFMEPADTLKATDGELGLRKIQFNFTYNNNNSGLSGQLRTESIPGTAIFYSNGLYLWSFRVPLKRPRSEFSPAELRELRGVLEGFLINDFVERHISHLFHFPWNPDPAIDVTHHESDPEKPEDYRGIMTYYQLDLLFNGVFDPSAHPHLSMGERPELQEQSIRNLEDKARQRYGVRYLIESLSLCAFNNEYFPLFDRRKEYTVRRTHGDKDPYIDSSISLEQRNLPPSNDEALHAREMFISRLAFAAMEQFLRVAISFGLTHYKAGLDHIRAELISQGMEARRSSRSSELRRPSLRSHATTLTDLEAYYALLAGKIPGLTFLDELMAGLSETTAPAVEVKANGVPGAIEWRFARKTLQEAQTQFTRMINAIRADRDAIESSFEAVRADQMLLELTEARKLAEITAETAGGKVEVTGGSVGLNQDQLGMLTVVLALIGLVVGLTEVFSNVGVSIAEKAYGNALSSSAWNDLAIIYWGSGIVVAVVGLLVGSRILRARLQRALQTPASEASKRETHVFDYSSLLREVKADGGKSAPVMQHLRESMIDIDNPRNRRRGSSFSTFHETPSTGIERTKYSLESPSNGTGSSYVLHVEFDRRLGGNGKERLLDIRLVVRVPATNSIEKVVLNSHEIIADCVKLLLFPGGPESEMKRFCRERFGWELSPAQGETSS